MLKLYRYRVQYWLLQYTYRSLTVAICELATLRHSMDGTHCGDMDMCRGGGRGRVAPAGAV